MCIRDRPKGIVHGTGGYLLYASLTMKYVFDLKETDIYWCTACLLYTSRCV